MNRQQPLTRSAVPRAVEQKEVAQQLHKLGNERRWEEALEVFASIEDPGPHMFYQALRACTRSLKEQAAWDLFDRMDVKSLPAYTLMMAMLARIGKVQRAEAMVNEIRAQGFTPNAAVFTTLITGHGVVRDSERAMSILDQMQAEGMPLTSIEFGCAMGACARAGDHLRARELLARMDASQVRPDVAHYTSLISAYDKSGHKDGARAAFDELVARGLTPDVVAYTSVAMSMTGTSAFQLVTDLRERMRAEDVEPNALFFNTWLRSALDARDLEGFRRVREEMERSGLHVDATTERRLQSYRELEAEGARPQAEAPASSSGHLPEGWQEATDPASGHPYYYRTADPAGSVTWDRPA